ncbi:MAG: hypothetical protein AMXMBFR84_46040 [Candidatus Hydrogenedentota bacterium]
MGIELLPVQEHDLPLIESWLVQPHVARWFGAKSDWLTEIASNLHSDWIWHFRVDANGTPIGFVQYYDVAKAPPGPWSHQPPHTYGIDFLVGSTEALRQGYGKAMLTSLYETIQQRHGPCRVVADPDEENVASIRALRSAGFHRDFATGLCIR